MSDKAILNILYTNIGRGHPYYLDGVVDRLEKSHSNKIKLNIKDVFEVSSGIPLRLWRAIRYLYGAGSQGGAIGKFYEILRSTRGAESGGILTGLLAWDICDFIKHNPHPTLVAHPLLVPMISGLVPVYYQHGEHAVPPEAAVMTARKIIVPTGQAADKFMGRGIPEKNLLISGLCSENELIDISETAYDNRIRRINSNKILTGGFFSSGAEPKKHIDKIIAMLTSLDRAGQRGIAFCRRGGSFENRLRKTFEIHTDAIKEFSEDPGNIFADKNIAVLSYSGRTEEYDLTSKCFPYLDYFAAPSHERTNWALGLGIPMFILHPIIGTFSPLNRNILLNNKTALDIDTMEKAVNFSSVLLNLRRDSILVYMAENGIKKYPIDGFIKTAGYIADELTVA